MNSEPQPPIVPKVRFPCEDDEVWATSGSTCPNRMGKRLLLQDLYHYLVGLANVLANCGDIVHADWVRHVSKFASGSASELYGEARLVLPGVLKEAGGKLPELDRARLREIIS